MKLRVLRECTRWNTNARTSAFIFPRSRDVLSTRACSSYCRRNCIAPPPRFLVSRRDCCQGRLPGNLPKVASRLENNCRQTLTVWCSLHLAIAAVDNSIVTETSRTRWTPICCRSFGDLREISKLHPCFPGSVVIQGGSYEICIWDLLEQRSGGKRLPFEFALPATSATLEETN